MSTEIHISLSDILFLNKYSSGVEPLALIKNFEETKLDYHPNTRK